jgi:hypothetical protein
MLLEQLELRFTELGAWLLSSGWSIPQGHYLGIGMEEMVLHVDNTWSRKC